MKKAKIFSKIALLLVFGFFATIYCKKIGYFKISEIMIEGNKFTDKENFLSKIDLDSINIFNMNLDKLDNLFKKNEYINETDFGFILPSMLVIQIYEYNPTYLFKIDNDYSFIDTYGKVITGSKKINQFYKVPILTFSSNAVKDNQIALFNSIKSSLLGIFDNYNEIYNEFKSITVNEKTMIIKSNLNTDIIIPTNEISKKIDHLNQLLCKDKKNINDYEYIDLSNDDRIIVKNRKENKWAIKE